MKEETIKILDGIIKKEDQTKIFREIEKLVYVRGERDRDEAFTATGEVSELPHDNTIFKILKNYVSKHTSLNFKDLKRSYVNKFFPNENPFFHTDGSKGITLLYYPNLDWNIDDGGDTQFIIKKEVRGIFPIPGRIVIFPAYLTHRGNAFRNKVRYTVALKF
jgi:hypothetical protein